jgi:beta-fructofuranosidase
MNKPHLLDPNESVMSAHVEAYSDHHHPKIHLTPPAYWMNDPNGLIFWDGYYHVFYQHNPFEAKWGYMHWGHAKSKDLITWDHEPIALAPSNEKKELHCFSGCCVDNNGVPTIVYSSIASLPKVLLGSDQWIATGDDKLQKWVKSTANPVLKPGIHGRKIILHLRDPYIWRQEDHWLMVLGGQQLFPKQGFVGIYSSQDLIHWTYLGPLIPKNSLPKSNFSSIWECPIFFPLKWGSSQKWVLIISPMDILYW